MWDLNIKAGSNPLDVLNADLSAVSPKTGMRFKSAARKNARNPRVSEKNGATYVKSNLGDGAKYNKNGEYGVSAAEAARIKREETERLRRVDLKQRREDLIIAEMLAEQEALMAEYDKNRAIR